MRYDVIIVGAGFAGAVVAERLAARNKKVLILESRNHIGGNAFDYDQDGILIHKYGPHIFHTNSEKVTNISASLRNGMITITVCLATSKTKSFRSRSILHP